MPTPVPPKAVSASPRRRDRRLLAWSLALLALQGCAHAQPQGGATPAHHDGDGFRNPYVTTPGHSPFAYWRMRLFGDEPFAEYAGNEHKVPRVPVDFERLAKPGSAAQVTWIGHATVLVQYAGKALLTDPVFSDRAGPTSFLGAKRYNAAPLSIDQLPPIDYVVISHNHYDQLDLDSVVALGNRPLWLVPLKLKAWFVEEAGIAPERVVELDWWEAHDDDGVRFTATPVQHWSARSLWDRFGTLWSSWAVEFDGFRLWFGGDTGYNTVQFREIGERLGPFDIGLIPIGAYAPRWFMKTMHINPEEAVTVHREVRARRSIGIHWGTFQLTAEPIDEPMVRLRAAVADAGLSARDMHTLAIGETLVVDGPLRTRE